MASPALMLGFGIPIGVQTPFRRRRRQPAAPESIRPTAETGGSARRPFPSTTTRGYVMRVWIYVTNYEDAGGGGGIRTHGTQRVHTLSRRAQSSTLAPLRNVRREPVNLPNKLCQTNLPNGCRSSVLAEGVGFEPTVPQGGTTVFETAPINHSGTPPWLF